ncbi:MAG: single-stranded DNA-binding protein [Oscillospiraceae bacterium]|jgi:single-strand DNA-binding protein|nr:single-stranded DNA-binding protein [Oscillospiraceae bacterium]
MLNRIIIMGRLVADPELRTTPTGTPVATVRLAVDRDFKNKQTGERETDFINVVAWRQTAEFISRYFTKGRMAVVEGRLQIRPYTDRDGNKRTAAEVVAENFYFGDSRRDGDGGGSYGGQSYGQPYSAPAASQQPPMGYSAPEGDDQFTELVGDESDLPF